ncbi:DUF932 domain-containing protein [Streptomyces sp. NPDC055722]
MFAAIEHADRRVCILGDHANRIAALDDQFRTETERVGRTAYAAERAITGYRDHVAPRRPGKTMAEEIARATIRPRRRRRRREDEGQQAAPAAHPGLTP